MFYTFFSGVETRHATFLHLKKSHFDTPSTTGLGKYRMRLGKTKKNEQVHFFVLLSTFTIFV